jgi:hypothetical protein
MTDLQQGTVLQPLHAPAVAASVAVAAFFLHLAAVAFHLPALPLLGPGAGQDAGQGVVALVAGVFVDPVVGDVGTPPPPSAAPPGW